MDSQFTGAQAVFVVIVGIGLLYVLRAASEFPFPAAAQIEYIIDSSIILARENESQGIIFSVADIGHACFAQDRCEECAEPPDR